jgi:DNA-binding transcriptional ArsR family regulator
MPLEVLAADVNPRAKLVYMALLNHLGLGKYYVKPSETRLAEMTGQSPRTIRNGIKDLEAADLIEAARRKGQVTHYYFRTPDRSSREPRQELPGSDTPEPRQDASGPRQDAHEPRQELPPNYLNH